MDQGVVIVHRSATRRKACVGCVKAKRRCDLTLPTCSRCRTKNLICSYLNTDVALAANGSSARHKTSPSRTLLNSSHDEPTLDTSVVDGCLLATPYDSFSFPEIVTIEPQQLEFCAFEFQRCMGSLVLEGRTPFIHPLLYEKKSPETYLDLIGMCSLYTQKTPQNYCTVLRMLEAKIEKLIANSSTNFLPGEWLLAVQTLIMYQIIRIFDGDTRQRANAERDFKLLEIWTGRLQEVYFEAELSSIGPRCEWIALESIRRTLMISILFRALYNAKNGVCELVPLMAMLPVSENAYGWDEEREPESSQNLVTYASFVDDWNAGKVTTVNTYEIMLLKLCPHAVFNGVMG